PFCPAAQRQLDTKPNTGVCRIKNGMEEAHADAIPLERDSRHCSAKHSLQQKQGRLRAAPTFYLQITCSLQNNGQKDTSFITEFWCGVFPAQRV
ncbi:MAG: hypothetical protein ABFC73_11505, partial [Clostridiaceae bacterium]